MDTEWKITLAIFIVTSITNSFMQYKSKPDKVAKAISDKLAIIMPEILRVVLKEYNKTLVKLNERGIRMERTIESEHANGHKRTEDIQDLNLQLGLHGNALSDIKTRSESIKEKVNAIDGKIDRVLASKK
jgi:hypothetical protein